MSPRPLPDWERYRKVRVLFVTVEVFPLAKTGGLADVCAGLPAMPAEFGVDVRLMMSAYHQAFERAIRKQVIAHLGAPPSQIVSALTADPIRIAKPLARQYHSEFAD
jgi:hypothetical protein